MLDVAVGAALGAPAVEVLALPAAACSSAAPHAPPVHQQVHPVQAEFGGAQSIGVVAPDGRELPVAGRPELI
ncbi:hypothetical protein [Streptomyces sp. NPDC001100]